VASYPGTSCPHEALNITFHAIQPLAEMGGAGILERSVSSKVFINFQPYQYIDEVPAAAPIDVNG
jgi:hypothetical protein